jgi:hypothetical protein
LGIEKDFRVKNGLVVGETIKAEGALLADLTVSANVEFTSTNAIKLPTGTSGQRPSGTAGQLRFNSDTQQFEGYNGIVWGEIGGSGGLAQWSVITEDYTILSGEAIFADTTAGSFTVSLPATPPIGSFVTISDGGDWSVNPLTVNRNGNTIEGNTENFLLDIKNVKVEFAYDGSTWQVYAYVGAQQSTTEDILIQTTSLAIALG